MATSHSLTSYQAEIQIPKSTESSKFSNRLGRAPRMMSPPMECPMQCITMRLPGRWPKIQSTVCIWRYHQWYPTGTSNCVFRTYNQRGFLRIKKTRRNWLLDQLNPAFWSNNSESLINKTRFLREKDTTHPTSRESSCIIVHHLYTRYTRPLNPCWGVLVEGKDERQFHSAPPGLRWWRPNSRILASWCIPCTVSWISIASRHGMTRPQSSNIWGHYNISLAWNKLK